MKIHHYIETVSAGTNGHTHMGAIPCTYIAADWNKFVHTYTFVSYIHKNVERQVEMKQVKDTVDNTITALTHSTNNTNYNRNKCKI